MMKKMGRGLRPALALIVAAAMLPACGYALSGRGNTLPATIKIIGIPLFTNQSQTPDMDQVLTKAVRDEFSNHGKYVVNPDVNGADAVLKTTILSVTYTISASTRTTRLRATSWS